ncbi:MAG: hypothetical protein GY754_22910 [bacterium]|nr:hypothetical protein [bacterium]
MTKLKKFKFLAVLTVLVMAVSSMVGCDGSEELENVDVHVGGNYMLGDNYYSCYWANGERIELNQLHSSVGVYGDGDDVYASASVKLSGRSLGKAAYWKNGVENELVSTWSSTRDIVVRDGEVTILGYTFDESNGGSELGHWIWKDGVFTDVEGFVMSMALSGDDVYLAGWYGNDDRTPCYWINGTRFDLDVEGLDLGGSIIRDIAVTADDVYVVGRIWDKETKGTRAGLWKNGARIELDSDGAEVFAVTTDGSDVYVAGQVDCTAAYWKNGQRISLGGDGCSYAMDLTVVNGDVYIAGHEAGTDNGVYVWKNDKNSRVELSIPWAVSRSAYANSIYVQPKN